jgi:hypothetical protein
VRESDAKLSYPNILVPDRLAITVDLDIGVIETTNTRHGTKILSGHSQSFFCGMYSFRTYTVPGPVLLHEDHNMLNVFQGVGDDN